ncbi:MAG: arylesterase [Gammaproteobacteria bacterium]|jgi:acyl-CoA thioesterase-1|nr:arylesterase [Gammaproteobacteria bacterium]
MQLLSCRSLVNPARALFMAAGLIVFAGMQSAVANERPSVLVLGDSLSAGYGMDVEATWVAMLETRLNEKGYGYRVINASISGDTTGNGLQRLPRALQLHQPEIVIIELGGNDGLRGLPVEVMRDNLEAMIVETRAAGALPVLAGILIPPNYGEDYASEFAAVYPGLAEEYDVPLIPFFMQGVALDPSKMQADGIHPNESAQAILLDNVWDTLWATLTARPEAA